MLSNGLQRSSSWIQMVMSTTASSDILPPEDFIAQIILGKGKVEFDLDRFEQAIQCFQEVLVRYPKTDAAPEAQYYLGVAKYKASHDPKQLKLGLEGLQRDYPNSEWTKKAQPYSLIPG